jgi:hypothetical protein
MWIGENKGIYPSYTRTIVCPGDKCISTANAWHFTRNKIGLTDADDLTCSGSVPAGFKAIYAAAAILDVFL